MKTNETRPTFRFLVSITPDEDMGLDDPKEVRRLIDEAIRDSGMDNGADINVMHFLTKSEDEVSE